MLTRLRARQPHAEAWGLCCFPDPNLTATQTCPVWLPETPSIFCGTAANIDLKPADNDGFHFSRLPHVAHILLDTVGRQHLILRIGGGTYQLSISEAPGIIVPVALSLRLHNLRDIASAVRQLNTLMHMLTSTTRSNSFPARWSTQNKRWRDALIALDGRRAGATFREIAAVIYGRERVDRDWPHAGLKVRVRRDLARGLDLCNSGYRVLLEKR